ncbi:hypothetical protein D779_0404 [Imhoffiella purpurea]|uniref:Uncharacterized protein n=1 Tax=Imhoffiella purpurea TaxID=1249627 RepID=W9VJL7_9GAMM|nr:hypothetical protein D779_0404 [Imhoffiella purpurea]
MARHDCGELDYPGLGDASPKPPMGSLKGRWLRTRDMARRDGRTPDQY